MAAIVGVMPDPPGHRIGDPPAVVDLAEDLPGCVPDVDHPAAIGVADRVGGDLVRGEDEVNRSLLADSGLPCVPLDQPPYWRQILLVGKRLGRRGWRSERAVAFRGQVVPPGRCGRPGRSRLLVRAA